MKNKFRFLLFLIFLNHFFPLFAETVTLNIATSDGHLVPCDIDDSTVILNISNFTPPFNKFDIDSISGLEQLVNLEVVQIIGLYSIVDFSFLCDAPNIKELYISSCIISSLKFLENLNNAELIMLDVYVVNEDYENIKNAEIDLSRLVQLKKLSFSASVIPNDYYKGFGCIPKFSYVQSHPDLILSNNEIESVSFDDLEILSQFNEISLWPNPILNNPDEMEKLKDFNINNK